MAVTLYPIGLNVSGRKCVVVGGGPVGARKMWSLVTAGAQVCVVAPEACPGVIDAVNAGQAEYIAAPFTPERLDGAFLTIAVTDNAEVNAQVVEAARARGVLVNLAGDAEGEDAGDFVTMAAVRRGDLLIGVTTGGAGPAVTAQVRNSLAAQFDENFAPYLKVMREMREWAKTEIRDPETRMEALRALAQQHGSYWGPVLPGTIDKARNEAMQRLREMARLRNAP